MLNALHKDTDKLEAADELADDKRARRVAYKGVKREMTLWKGPVHKNRLADQVIFPINDNAVTMSNSAEAQQSKLERHVVASKEEPSSLQGKLYGMLYGKQLKSRVVVEDKVSKINRLMAKELKAKIAARNKERYLLARFAANNKRQNKIKSKRYHRHLKDRMMKEYAKETEQMRTNDPKAFAKRLLSAELERSKERASLRHRSGGKFARLQKLRAKYDKEVSLLVSVNRQFPSR